MASRSSTSAVPISVSPLTKLLVLSDHGFLNHKSKVPAEVMRLKPEQIQYIKVGTFRVHFHIYFILPSIFTAYDEFGDPPCSLPPAVGVSLFVLLFGFLLCNWWLIDGWFGFGDRLPPLIHSGLCMILG